MTTYVPVPAYAERKAHPKALMLILAAHAAVLTAVILIKTDVIHPPVYTKTTVDLIPIQDPPPLKDVAPQPKHQLPVPSIDHPPQVVPLPQLPTTPDVTQTPPTPINIVADPTPTPVPLPPATIVRTGPRFVTPESELRPPYPSDKLATGEEAALQLRLTIDARGRVTDVQPVGRVDRSCFAAARRHLIAHWRYPPATEDGRAVASSTVITLRFQLDQ
jgi:protein TonB